MKKPTLSELLEQNPDVDQELLDRAMRTAGELREAGFEGTRYRLATPKSKATAVERPDAAHETHAHHLVRRH